MLSVGVVSVGVVVIGVLSVIVGVLRFGTVVSVLSVGIVVRLGIGVISDGVLSVVGSIVCMVVVLAIQVSFFEYSLYRDIILQLASN